MSDMRDGECPTCGDLAVDVSRAGDVVTMRCADAACGREFQVSRVSHVRDRVGLGRISL